MLTAITNRGRVASHIWLKVINSPSANRDTLNVIVKAVADSAFNNVKLRIGIVTTFKRLATATRNGMTTFYWPFDGFAGSTSAGYSFTHSGRTSDTLTFTGQFPVRSTGATAFTADSCAAIVWVQNETSSGSAREVYQSAYKTTCNVTAPVGDELFFVGDTTHIMWEPLVFSGNLTLLYNRNYPTGTWDTITTSAPNTGSYTWTVPGPTATACRIKIVEGNHVEISPKNFQVVGITSITLSPDSLSFTMDTLAQDNASITIRNSGTDRFIGTVSAVLGRNEYQYSTSGTEWFVADTGNSQLGPVGRNTAVGPYPMDIQFPMFGYYYPQFIMSSSGFITFNSIRTTTSTTNTEFPTNVATTMLAPFWDDLTVPDGQAYYLTDLERGIAVFAWEDVYRTGDPSSTMSFEIILNANDGTIKFVYRNMTGNLSSATIGIQSSATEFTQIAYNTAVPASRTLNLSPLYSWGNASPVSFVLGAGAQRTIGINANSYNIHTDSSLTGTIQFRGNIPAPVTIPVALRVGNGTQSAGEPIEMPSAITVSEAYPNPFNPSTTVNFTVPTSMNITMRLFDVTGREVETLFSGKVNAGTHSQLIRADKLATGIYFLKFEASRYSAVRKLVLVK